MNSFRRDDEWQRAMRERFLAPFYGRHARAGRFVFIEKSRCSMLVQKRLAVDTIAESPAGGTVCIEEKITRFPRTGRPHVNFFLETDSCTTPGHESDGWMKYGQADYLLYCFHRPDLDPECLDAYRIDFAALRSWFWPRHSTYRAYTMPNTINKTRGSLVPIVDVCRAVVVARLSIYQGTAELAA